MKRSNSGRSQFRSFPKENSLGTGGIQLKIESALPVSGHSQIIGNGREWAGTSEHLTKPSKGLFFHWCDAEGAIENQGYLLSISASGSGTAQLFEWFMGEPSRVIEVTPDYLRACIFYASDKAMNAAYEAYLEAGHD